MNTERIHYCLHLESMSAEQLNEYQELFRMYKRRSNVHILYPPITTPWVKVTIDPDAVHITRPIRRIKHPHLSLKRLKEHIALYVLLGEKDA